MVVKRNLFLTVEFQIKITEVMREFKKKKAMDVKNYAGESFMRNRNFTGYKSIFP